METLPRGRLCGTASPPGGDLPSGEADRVAAFLRLCTDVCYGMNGSCGRMIRPYASALFARLMWTYSMYITFELYKVMLSAMYLNVH